MRVMKEMGKKMREEEKYKEIMLEGPQILAVDDFGDSAVTVKGITNTAPLEQGKVVRE
jgi:hypothetical protein